MNKDLSDFLADGILLSEESANWGGNMPLQITLYLTDKLPPLEYVSSVRAVVFQGPSVLVITQKNGEMHIIPGGRVEPGELLPDTLKRELLEETGWTLTGLKMLGCMHLHHLAPKPENYAYPHPDFLWPIYLADADNFNSQAITADDYALSSNFKPIEEVRKLPLPKGSLMLLDATLKLR